MIDEREAAERARIEADNKAAIKRVSDKKAMQGVSSADEETTSSSGASTKKTQKVEEKIDEYNLSAVDWSVGRQAFVEEWTARINNYLTGTALAGYGEAFAEAAWANGVDPRWSPAISNTESGNGITPGVGAGALGLIGRRPSPSMSLVLLSPTATARPMPPPRNTARPTACIGTTTP